MFIRKIKTPQGTDYFHLVESYREGGKVRQRTLLPLGRAGEGRLENLVSAVRRHGDFMTAAELAKKLSVPKTFILGPLLVLEKLFEKLGLNEVLEDLPKSRKRLFDARKVLFALVASRFACPGSKLKVYEHWQNLFYPGLFSSDIKLHQIYRVLDYLSLNKEKIEKSLYWRGRDLFNYEVDVVLYDLTTLRFESQRADLGRLRQFGYSKERRGDLVQVILGLLVDKGGFPLGFEVYPGNTFEGKTVSDIERKLRRKFNVRRFIFVGDRGLFSKRNLEIFDRGEKREGEGKERKEGKEGKGGEFIIGMKLGAIKSRHKDFYNKRLFKRVQEGLSVYETKYEGKRLIITWSSKRAERDRKAREELLLKIKKKLSSGCSGASARRARRTTGARDFITNEAYKRYVCLSKAGQAELNEKAIEEASKRDGFFGVVTNVKNMSAVNLVSHYKELWKVESAFGELKGTLKARPVFHWTDKRIVGHLLMCFIAYMCEAYLTRCLREKKVKLKRSSIERAEIKGRPLTVSEAMRDLLEVRAVPVQVDNRTLWIRTEIEGNAANLFKVAGVRIPSKLLKIEGEESMSL